MSVLPATERLSAEGARVLTDEVKRDAHALWRKLLQLYEGGAHLALGYSSWGAYYEAEFGGHPGRGYQLLQAAEVRAALDRSYGAVIHSTNVERELPRTEAVARELAPLKDQPDEMRRAWDVALDSYGPSPTAIEVKAVVDRQRGRMDVHYSSATDEWATPQDFFDVLDAEFAFDLDVCALPTSAKCERYFTPDDNGLAQDWDGTCWMNPPYGTEIGWWVAKAHQEARDGATVVCLVPARVDTGWWWDHCRHAEIRFLRGRLKFGGADTSAPFPSALVVFGRPPRVVWWEWQ